MQLKYIDASLQKDWEILTKKNKSSGYMQSFFWNDFKKMLGWQIFKIGIFKKEKLIGGAIIGKYTHYGNFNFLTISEGPVLPYNTKDAEKMFEMLISEIDKIANLKGNQLSSHLSIEPKLQVLPDYFSRFKKAKEDQQPKKTLIIDLSLTHDQILSQMKPKGRYNIKVAIKNNVTIYHTSFKDGINDFLKLYKHNLKKDNFTVKENSYFKALAFIAQNNHIGEIFFAKYQNKNIATAMLIYYGNTVTYLFGAMNPKYKAVMAPYLLHFEIIKQSKENNFLYYDLYGLSPDEKDTTYPWYGFSVFKRKFGGEEINYIGAYDFIYNQKLYKEFLRKSI